MIKHIMPWIHHLCISSYVGRYTCTYTPDPIAPPNVPRLLPNLIFWVSAAADYGAHVGKS